MSDISRSCVLTIPEAYWPDARKALRMLREIHRDAGGTTKLVRQGERTTLTATGSPAAVGEATQNALKVQELINKVHREQLHTVLDNLVSRRSRRRAEMSELLTEAIRNAQRGKVP